MLNKESASVKKMVSDLAIEGFSFHEDFDEVDEFRFGKLFRRRRLDNIVFEKEGISLKIYRDLFYRATGISHLFDDTTQKSVRVSDFEFFEMQKHLIKYRFEQRMKQLKASDPENPLFVHD
jgi:hypothetical protein